jgi:uncharacterized protein (TIGR03435 family)
VNPAKGFETHTDIALLLQQALKSAFGLIGRKITQETNVLVLKVIEAKAPGLVTAATTATAMHSQPGDLEGSNLSMADLATALEVSLKMPVVDETGLTNRYDVNLRWQHYPKEVADAEMVRAVRQQLGLELEPAKRPVEMWVVEAIK